jgi:hypothetical protein
VGTRRRRSAGGDESAKYEETIREKTAQKLRAWIEVSPMCAEAARWTSRHHKVPRGLAFGLPFRLPLGFPLGFPFESPERTRAARCRSQARFCAG